MVMEWIGRWLWDRHRQHFVLWLAAMLMAILACGLWLPGVVVGALYLDLTWGEAVVWALAMLASLAVGTILIVATLSGEREVVRRWAEGDETAAREAWQALVRLPQQLGGRIAVVFFPLNVVATFPLVMVHADAGALGIVTLGYAFVLVIGAGAVLTTSILQLLVRTAATDAGATVGSFEEPLTNRWTIRVRLVVSTFVATSAVGATVALLVRGTAVDERDYAVAFFGGGALSAVMVLLLDIGLFRATVTPIADLIQGSGRVARGELGIWVPVSSQDELGDLAVAFNTMQAGLREREALHAAFGSYVDPSLAQRLLDSGSSVFEGEEVDVTVVFADVRSFTAYSETVPPAQAVALLNRLFDVVVPVLHDHGGHANHYLGDGLLAVFGSPQPLNGHADAAVAAAVEIQRRVRIEFGHELQLGIGVNTGPVIAGTVGGGGRHEFTVIGDTVNAASRVEQLTKETGDHILITEATRCALSTPRPSMTSRGEFEVRGKASRLTLHSVNAFPRSTR